MRILILTHSFNGLAQRLHVELSRADHELAVELDINDETTMEAAERFQPDVIIAPYLNRLIPVTVWQAHPCMIVHPGIPGDGGSSSLDWAILDREREWGVTVLQATGELDAGPVWSFRYFPLRDTTKSVLYRMEMTQAAVDAVMEALDRFSTGIGPVPVDQLEVKKRGRFRSPVRQRDRSIDWQHDDTETVLRKIRSADSNPGVLDQLAGLSCRLYDAHGETTISGKPGTLIARRDEAVCCATRDGSVWIGHLKPEGRNTFKLPAARVLGDRIQQLPEWFDDTVWQEIRYVEAGDVSYLSFDFYNGAMNTSQCNRLRLAFEHAASRPTRVIVLQGGEDFWSNGLDLNTIEAASSSADESWRNINAMDDLCEAIIRTTSHLTVSAMRGNAAAGGCFLAFAADLVMAREGIVLSPHYRNMGNLYGSEFWSYVLPTRVESRRIDEILDHRLPMGSLEALDYGLIDQIGSSDPIEFDRDVAARAHSLSGTDNFRQLIRDKQALRLADESERPLSDYRREELAQMHLNFYGFDPSYHVARYKFVHHKSQAWTPLYLAPHRQLKSVT